MEGYEIVYNEDMDTLIIYWNKQPAVSVDYGGDFWLRVHPITKEPVGIEIEGFRKHFLEKYGCKGSGKCSIKVEIPEGDYCSGGLTNPEVSCDYMGDSCASSAGLCSLLVKGDCLLEYEDRETWKILKRKNCPSKL